MEHKFTGKKIFIKKDNRYLHWHHIYDDEGWTEVPCLQCAFDDTEEKEESARYWAELTGGELVKIDSERYAYMASNIKIIFRESLDSPLEELYIDELYERANECTILMTAETFTLDGESQGMKETRTHRGELVQDAKLGCWDALHGYERLGIDREYKNVTNYETMFTDHVGDSYKITFTDHLGDCFSRPLTQALIIDYGIQVVNELV